MHATFIAQSVVTGKGVALLKHAANIISAGRIVASPLLFFSLDNAPLFLVLYLICGLSDVLDGYIARKTNTESELGARLNSVADLILFTAITVSIVLWLGDGILVFLPWLLITVLIRCTNIAIAACKYHSFAILHTWGNKLTGALVFLTPVFVRYQLRAGLWVVCLTAVLSAAEEGVIHLTSAKLEINRRSILKI